MFPELPEYRSQCESGDPLPQPCRNPAGAVAPAPPVLPPPVVKPSLPRRPPWLFETAPSSRSASVPEKPSLHTRLQPPGHRRCRFVLWLCPRLVGQGSAAPARLRSRARRCQWRCGELSCLSFWEWSSSSCLFLLLTLRPAVTGCAGNYEP